MLSSLSVSLYRLSLLLLPLLTVGGALPAVAQDPFWPPTQYFHEEVTNLSDNAQASEKFGAALAVGDFDGDLVPDLAIGVPEARLGTIVGGAVHVIYSNPPSALALPDQFWTQGSLPASGEIAETGDRFGSALAAGDFNNDGIDDLAVGVFGEQVSGQATAGAVHVVYGTFGVGLTATGAQFWNQNSSGIIGDSEAGDEFGRALAAGDFNRDGIDDLAVGVPGEDLEGSWPFGTTYYGAGAVEVIFGFAGLGLNGSGSQWIDENSSLQSGAIPDSAGDSDRFGDRLAACDFNGDLATDLAIAATGESGNNGSVTVLAGASSFGVTGLGAKFFSQGSGIPSLGEGFGLGLGCGRVGSDAFADLVVGFPGAIVGSAQNAGVVMVLPGSLTGVSTTGMTTWSQDSPNIEEVAESGDRFGEVVAVGDANGDGFDDVAITAGNEFANRTGAVHVIFAISAGLKSSNDQLWTQNSQNVGGVLGPNQNFGAALAFGNFDQLGGKDLAIGAATDFVTLTGTTTQVNAGSVNVIYDLGYIPPIIGF